MRSDLTLIDCIMAVGKFCLCGTRERSSGDCGMEHTHSTGLGAEAELEH